MLRDAGMALVLSNAGAEWRRQYAAAVGAWFASLRAGDTFTSESMRYEAQQAGVYEPHKPQAWSANGGVMVRGWIAAGLVVECGRTRSKSAASHACDSRRYMRI